MAASKVDLSLDDLVTLRKRRGRGRGGPAQKIGRVYVTGRKPFAVGGGEQQRARPVMERLGVAAAKTVKPGGDLRDILASKQKKQVVDLRAKIKPKSSSVSRGRGRPYLRGGRVPAGTRRERSRSPIRKPYVPIPFSSPPSAPPTPDDARRQRESPIRLPSSAETKKITVTVPGLNRPVSEVS